ncbi:uncharacterized protein LOC112679896 isoform X3 [Sipha flava]|uniref:Uncharacterized protein LOC112679896 isoform X3 n=1 Tax=Sipha flava TaxID=143950 RepID=A0A8B8F5K9_9HEMI|nr:uncharacterized protein LOC112679896 isoform X3 [Sipha flava]
MDHVCAVISCRNSKLRTKEHGIKMHRFPRDMPRRYQWLTNCNRLDLHNKIANNYRVCDKHFTSKMYTNSEQTFLLPTAVPTQFKATAVFTDASTVKRKNDFLFKKLDSSGKLKKSNISISKSCEMSSNGITIPECSETSTVTCSQTTQLQSVNTPKKKSISSSVPKLKNKFKTISEAFLSAFEVLQSSSDFIEYKFFKSKYYTSTVMASYEDKLISMDGIEDFLEKSTSNCTDKSTTKCLEESMPGSPEPVTCENLDQSVFECLESIIRRSLEQLMYENCIEFTFECPQQFLSQSPKRLMPENSEQSTSESPQQLTSQSPKQFMSESPLQSTSESPQQLISQSPKQFMPENSEQSASESLQQSLSRSSKQFMPGNSEQSTSESLQQSISKSPNQLLPGNVEQSTSESPEKSTSRSPKKSISEFPESVACKSPEKLIVECPVPSTSSENLNSIQWVVGYFEEENVYSVIPSNWLLNENGCWFSKWPNSSYKATIEARIISASKPAKTWKYYAVKIIKRYDTYNEAEKETFLCVPNSDQTNFGRGKRKKLSNIRQIDFFGDDSDDEISETDTSMKSKVYLKNSSSMEQNSSSNDSLLDTQNTKISSINKLTTNEKTVNIMNDSLVLNKNNTNSGSSINNTESDNKANEKTVNITNNSLVLNKNNTNSGSSINNTESDNKDLASFPSCVFKCIYRINEKLDSLNKLLNSGSLFETRPKTLDQAFLSLFPMKDTKDLLSIDSRLTYCTEFEEKFIFYIMSLNCTTVKDFVRQNLNRLFTNSLATSCTWFGFKGKFELKKLKMLNIMNDVSSAKFSGHTDNVFKLFVKEWFKHGKKRFNRELNKKSRPIVSS